VLVQTQERFLGEIRTYGAVAGVEGEQTDEAYVLPLAQLCQRRIDLIAVHCRSMTGSPDTY
jgi:hypothetical protein